MVAETVQEIKNTIRDELDGVHTAFPATITAVDTANGKVTVLPAIKKTMPNGTKVNYPTISGVPLVFPSNGSAGIVFPVNVGDSCLVVVSEQSLESWLYGMETDTVLDFDISNSIAIPGLQRTAPSAFAQACSSGQTVISGSVAISGSVTISGGLTVNGYLQANGGSNIG